MAAIKRRLTGRGRVLKDCASYTGQSHQNSIRRHSGPAPIGPPLLIAAVRLARANPLGAALHSLPLFVPGERPGLIHRQGALDVRVEELVDELVARVEELVGGAGLDDTALPEDRDEVGDPACGTEVVADHQVAAAVLL